MSGLLERAASVFVEPRPGPAPPPPVEAPPRFASRALVLGAAADAVPLAAALAGGLRERERAAGALLVVWPTTEPSRPALGTPAAARLVAGLQARGLEAVARGRLAWLGLAHADLGLARRALAAVDVPAVIAITGPRSAATDELLAEQDHIVLVVPTEADQRLTDLARTGLAEYDVPLTIRGPLTAPGARTTALAGWGRLRLPA
jgi:hypothetical protein